MRGLTATLMAMAGAAALGAAALPAQAASVLDVNWNSGCGASNCFNQDGVFSQTWSSAGAAGPMTIGQFLLDRGILGNLDGQTFNISFSIGGHTVGTWGNYMMAGIGGDTLTFGGENFVWNPEDGDLVLTLSIIHPDAPGLGGGLFSLGGGSGGGAGGSGAGGNGGGEGAGSGEGSFDIGPPGGTQPGVDGVPEPATWALMIAGFGLAGATLRQRRRIVA